MIEQGGVGHVDLVLGEHGGDRDHDGELPGLAAEIVRHGHDSAVLVAHQHHPRGAIEELGVTARDVESAEATGLRRPQREAEREPREGQGSFHILLQLS